MNNRYTPSRQEVSLIASAITIVITYYTQAWHHIPYSYGSFVLITAPTLFTHGINKWTSYAAGVVTGMAIYQGYVSPFSQPMPSLAQWGIIFGFSMFSLALTWVIEYFVNRHNL